MSHIGCLVALLAATAAAASPASLSVDCAAGSDTTGDGSAARPFRTLMRARDAVRASRPLSQPLDVLVAPGDCFPRDATTGALNFSAPLLSLDATLDSGTAATPITWRALNSSVPVRTRVLAGSPVPPAAWSSYGPIAGCFQADLGPRGIDVARYGFGSLAAGGLGTCSETAMELFVEGVPQVVARYPNVSPNGSWAFLNIDRVVNPQRSFTVNGTAAARALSLWQGTQGIWAHGFWSFDWADSYVSIASINAVSGSSAEISTSTPPVYGFLPTARFYITNSFAELDAPGEYFINVTTNMLYYIPAVGVNLASAEAFLSIADYGITTDDESSAAPPMLSAEQLFRGVQPARPTPVAGEAGVLSFVMIDSIDVHFARIAGVSLNGVASVVVSSLDASNHGHNGVRMFGSNNTISQVTVKGTGCAASSMYGGDLATLTPGNNSVLDSTFSQYARTIRTYNAGIAFGGVGNLYARNMISNAPHTGALGGGALNLFIENTFDTLCYEATDSGAWYAGRSWANRGNLIQGNTFVNIRNREHMTLGYAAVQAVYLDDELSGTVIRDNVCIDSQTCFFVGGGRDTVVAGNTCAGDVDTCVHIDDRGLGWQADSCAFNSSYTGDLVAGLFAVHYTKPPYATAFPEIVSTLQRRPCTPVNISVANNRFCATSTKNFADFSAENALAWGDDVRDNTPMDCA